MMTAEVDASFISLGDGFSGRLFTQNPMDGRGQRNPALHVNVNMHHDRGKMKTMSYRDTRAKSPPPFDDEANDFGPHSPELPKFDYNNDRIHNDLLQEICSDIGIKDAMDLDFFDFDAEPLEFLDRRLSDKDGLGGLDQVIPFGQIQKEAEDADTKHEQSNPLVLAMTTAGITTTTSGCLTVTSPSKRAPSLCSSPIRNSNLDKFQSVSETTIYSPAKSHLSTSQFSSSPARSSYSDRFSDRVGSPCAPPSVESQRSAVTPKPEQSPFTPRSPSCPQLYLEDSSQSLHTGSQGDSVTVKSEDGALASQHQQRHQNFTSASGKLSSSQALSTNPQLQTVRGTGSLVPHKQMPRVASGQGRNLSSPFDPGYYSAGSPSLYAASHCESNSDVDHKSVTPPLGDVEQSVADKVNHYLDRSVPTAQKNYSSGKNMYSVKEEGSSLEQQSKHEGQDNASLSASQDGRNTPEFKTEMKPPSTPTHDQGALEQKRQQWMLQQKSMVPGGVTPQQPAQLGIPGYPTPPATLRSGSNPSSPKKQRTDNIFLPRPQASAYPPTSTMGGSRMPTDILSSQERLAQDPIMSAVPPQSPFHPQHLRGTSIANQQLENPSGQQMKRRHGFTPPPLTVSSSGQPRTPRKGTSKMPYHGLPVDPSTLPVFASQHGFVQQLILDRSAAFRSHPLFPLLRDLIIADMNFYQPTFPFQLISNLPRDFERLLTNYRQRNPSQAARDGNEAIEGVIMDALKYAHKALTEKILQKSKDEGIELNKPNSAIEEFCAQFDISVKSTFPGKKSADGAPTSSMGQNPGNSSILDTSMGNLMPPGRTPSRGQHIPQPQASVGPSGGMMGNANTPGGMMGNNMQQPIANKNAYMMNTSVASTPTQQHVYNSSGMQHNMKPQSGYDASYPAGNNNSQAMPQNRYLPQNNNMQSNMGMHRNGRMTPTSDVQSHGQMSQPGMGQAGRMNPAGGMYGNQGGGMNNTMYTNNGRQPNMSLNNRVSQSDVPPGSMTGMNRNMYQMNNNSNNNNNNNEGVYPNSHMQQPNSGMGMHTPQNPHRMYQNPRMSMPNQMPTQNPVTPSHGVMPSDAMHRGQNVLNNTGMPPSGGNGQGNNMVPNIRGMSNVPSNYGAMPGGNYGMARPPMMQPNNMAGPHQRMPGPRMPQMPPQTPNYGMQTPMPGTPQHYPPQAGGTSMHRSMGNPNLAIEGLPNMNLVETMRRQFPQQQQKIFADSHSTLHRGYHDNKENHHMNMPAQDLVKSETLLIDFESEIIPPLNVSPEQAPKSETPPMSSSASVPSTPTSRNINTQSSLYPPSNRSTSSQPELHITTSEFSERPASNGPSSAGSAHSQTITVANPMSSGDSSESGTEGNAEHMMGGANLPKKHQVLPKEAVAIMVEWLQHHTDNPYPKEDEKEVLMKQTNLTINQINYWFTNARRRILPKWRLQRILEEQARATGEDPSKVKVTGSAQEIRAVTKELLQGRTVETFLANSKVLGGSPHMGGCPPVPMGALSQTSMSGMPMSLNNNYNDLPHPGMGMSTPPHQGMGMSTPHMPTGGSNAQMNDLHEMHHGGMGHGVYGSPGMTPSQLGPNYNPQHDQQHSYQDLSSRMGPTLQQL